MHAAMLAGMSSLALLAHHHPASPAFNGLFYGTAATLIPVFFLALAVQGGLYETLLRGADKAADYERKAANAAFLRQIAGGAVGLAGIVPQLIAYAILAFGIGGEITAINALSTQKAGSDAHAFVYLASIVLAGAIGLSPALAFLASLWRSTGAPWWESVRAAARTARLLAQQRNAGTQGTGTPTPAQDPAPPAAGGADPGVPEKDQRD
jgi:hypothetical protein